MIVVLLGTQKQPFKRIISMVEELVIKRNIKDQIIVQAGNTEYDTDLENIKLEKFLPKYKETIKKADLVITHGGVGSIMDSLEFNKKIIVVPRLSQYKEHVDDHQKEISRDFSLKGYVLECNTKEQLFDIYENKLDNFKPEKYISNNKEFNKKLNDIIESIL